MIMRLSRIRHASLGDAENAVWEAAGPVVLTGVVAANAGGVAGASVAIMNGAGTVTHLVMTLGANDTAVWAGRVQLTAGVQGYVSGGTVAVTVMYEDSRS